MHVKEKNHRGNQIYIAVKQEMMTNSHPVPFLFREKEISLAGTRREKQQQHQQAANNVATNRQRFQHTITSPRRGEAS